MSQENCFIFMSFWKCYIQSCGIYISGYNHIVVKRTVSFHLFEPFQQTRFGKFLNQLFYCSDSGAMLPPLFYFILFTLPVCQKSLHGWYPLREKRWEKSDSFQTVYSWVLFPGVFLFPSNNPKQEMALSLQSSHSPLIRVLLSNVFLFLFVVISLMY